MTLEESSNSNWTDDEIDTLKALAAKNLHARDIAGHIPGKSRNAILGKAFRLGLHLNAATVSKPGFWTRDKIKKLEKLCHSTHGYSPTELAAQFGIGMPMLRRGFQKMRQDPQMKGVIKKPPRRPGAAKPKAPTPVIVDLPTEENLQRAVTIAHLTSATCRFPVQGQGYAMLYCGREPIPDRPYCPLHAFRAYAR